MGWQEYAALGVFGVLVVAMFAYEIRMPEALAVVLFCTLFWYTVFSLLGG